MIAQLARQQPRRFAQQIGPWCSALAAPIAFITAG
jgi:hypothetical protein